MAYQETDQTEQESLHLHQKQKVVTCCTAVTSHQDEAEVKSNAQICLQALLMAAVTS